jgi:hypothetical protein
MVHPGGASCHFLSRSCADIRRTIPRTTSYSPPVLPGNGQLPGSLVGRVAPFWRRRGCYSTQRCADGLGPWRGYCSSTSVEGCAGTIVEDVVKEAVAAKGSHCSTRQETNLERADAPSPLDRMTRLWSNGRALAEWETTKERSLFFTHAIESSFSMLKPAAFPFRRRAKPRRRADASFQRYPPPFRCRSKRDE